MARNYNDWLNEATKHRKQLDQAIRDDNAKDIIYYRGKYLFALKKAYTLLPVGGMVPKSVTGYGYDTTLVDEIRTQLGNHARQIEKSIQDNKQNASIDGGTLNKELALKLRRLSTRADQINFTTSSDEHDQAVKDVTSASAGLVGTVVGKAPIMAAAKVVSAVGPLAITVVGLPFTVFSALLTFTVDAYNGKVTKPEEFNNAPVIQISNALKDGVKKLSKVTYETAGRI